MSFTTTDNLLPPLLQKLIPYYILVLAVAVFYSGVYDNAFLYDDRYLIQKNSYLHSWHSLGTIFQTYVNSGALRTGHFYRPLQNVLYLILYQSFGESTFAFHLLNNILHAANACLAYMLGRKLGFNPWAVFFAALIWAVHPLHTEAVTYMSATADTLGTFFCLLATVIVVPDFAPRKFWLAVPVAILGLLSKETAIILPLLVMSCIYLLSDRRLDPRTYFKTWPLWLVTLGYMAIRFAIMPFTGKELLNIDPMSVAYGQHFYLRFYTFLATIPAYLQLLVWPEGLHMDRNFAVRLDPWFFEVKAGFIVLLALMAQVFFCRKSKRPALSWGIIWFACAHFPQTSLLIPVNSLFLEHWMYLPTIGLSLGAAGAIASKLTNGRIAKAAGICAAFVALTLGIATFKQNEIWHDPIVFYKNILDRGEPSERSRNNLGVIYIEQGEYAKAMEQFQLTLKDHDLTPETHQNIAALLSKIPDGQDHTQEEIAELNKALAINPNFLSAYQGLADLYTYKGDKEKAAFYQQKVDELKKNFEP